MVCVQSVDLPIVLVPTTAILLQCVTITSCGNFAVAGMSTGHIELFNMQSGLHRGELGRPRGGCGNLL